MSPYELQKPKDPEGGRYAHVYPQQSWRVR